MDLNTKTDVSYDLKMTERHRLFSELVLLGNYYGLRQLVSEAAVHNELEAFADDWKLYNPNKPTYKRWGLSVTSLDGELTGLPDLTSLLEHNRIYRTEYSEMSFTKLTQVYKHCKSLHEIIDPFLPYLGRTHFLRFETGGFFPYHRDCYRPDETFRIFVPLHIHSQRDFVFLLGPEKIELEKGRPYFINTLMEHALFSFASPSTHLVMNVRLCQGSVDVLRSNLTSY